MKSTLILSLIAAGVFTLAPGIAGAAPEVGRPAPDFSLTDLNGQKHSLAEYRGRTVVLEWINPDCPFVHKHYDSGNMPGLQKAALADGVVWLSINSAATGFEGDYDDAAARSWLQKEGWAATGYFRDHDGRVGKLYDARTTPHMFVIDPQGTLVYAGGIDSIRSADIADIPKATNYVKEALADLKAGRPVRTKTAKPYGCSVKYGH